MILTLIVLLPFLGSLCAAFLPSNARNAEAWLAGVLAVACFFLVRQPVPAGGSTAAWSALPGWAPQLGLDVSPAHGRLRVAVRAAGLAHGRAGGAVRALLHVARRPGAALLLVPAGVHGRDARHRAVGQPDPAGGVLGADQPHLVHADRLLVPPRRRAARRAHGADRDGRRRPVPAARRAAARRDRRQLRPRRRAGGRRRHPRAPLVSGHRCRWSCSAR